jgi:hypothetical protein
MYHKSTLVEHKLLRGVKKTGEPETYNNMHHKETVMSFDLD